MKTNNTIPENETKNEKFLRIATPRVNAIIDKLDILSNCAGSNYEYTEEQVETMFQALRDAMDACYNEFRPKVKSEKERFSF
jgi:hypothetical protein